MFCRRFGMWPFAVATVLLVNCDLFPVRCAAAADAKASATPADGAAVKSVLDVRQAGENLLTAGGFHAYEKGFVREGNLWVCDNGSDAKGRRGVAYSLRLNQTRPEPIVAAAWSKAEGVSGSADSNYSVYIDLVYTDGSTLWGQSAPFSTGSHDWQRRQVVVLPDKPVKSLSFYMLFREHAGKAWFRDPELYVIHAPAGSHRFDGVPVVSRGSAVEGFQVRDVAAGSDFLHIEKETLGLTLQVKQSQQGGATLFDVTLSDTTGKDRAVTLIYAVPIGAKGLRWFEDPRRATEVEAGQEIVRGGHFPAGANGRLSRYPLGAVQSQAQAVALGIDMARPAFFRIGCNAGTGELFLAYDIGLTLEKPTARVRFCRFAFDPAWAFRGALERYYAIFPEAFRCRTPEQGLWMPFAPISKVKGWEDFGFKFKEGSGETKWDDEHGITTFRYTEPMTWWMSLPKDTPRTMEAALAEAQRLAAKNVAHARALFTSGYHDEHGQIPARLLDTPWCNGAVWSMNSMPGVRGEVTDFNIKWSPKIRERLYGPKRKADLDGEYIDSSEGYVTDVLDFRRDHFAVADTPLCFAQDSRRPAIFRGLVAFEYARGLANDVHTLGKLMMANSTPIRLCWLAPLLEVMGTETDWHRQGRWMPMSDTDLLYRRTMCKGKPYCFLMNTHFEEFSSELVEKYMKRSLAYGMFPGFFSHNASQGQYFTRPELYDRDRPLFKKYVPLCKLVAEAGWEPIPEARSDKKEVYVERFGGGPGVQYLTVFNDSQQRQTVTIRLERKSPTSSRELVRGGNVTWQDQQTTLALGAEDVAVIEIKP